MVAWWFVVAVGCKKTVVEEIVVRKEVYPDLHCPEGSEAVGTPPPLGTSVWCQANVGGTIQRHGPSIEWYGNEQRKAEGEYQRGMMNGQWQYWYPHGPPQMQGSYVRNVKDGFWVEFHPSGARKSEGQMVAGKEHGVWTYWADDGSSRTEGEWVLGVKTGVWTDYGSDGAKIRERTFREGRLIDQREFHGSDHGK